jgi:hypothetical protein
MSSDDIFSKDALDAEIKKLPDLPPEQGGVGVVAKEGGDLGVEGSVNKKIGDGGAFVEAQGSWMRKAGWSIGAWFGWKGK